MYQEGTGINACAHFVIFNCIAFVSLVLFNCLALVSLVYINTGFILVAGQTAKDKGHSMSVFNTCFFFFKFYIPFIHCLFTVQHIWLGSQFKRKQSV